MDYEGIKRDQREGGCQVKKKILFVINTMGGAGAETAMIEMIHRLDPSQ